MNDIQPFDFDGQAVRVVTIDGEPWFVGTDVARVLGYANPSDALARHLDDDEQTTATLAIHEGSREVTRDRTLINESGIYALTFGSNLPTAKRFKRWVKEDVLPSIRKTGQYGTPAALTGPELMAAALIEAQATLERAHRQIEADRPKVLFADAVATSQTDILVGDLAKILRGNGVEVGAIRLFEMLRNDGYLIRRKGTDWNMPTQRSMELGLFRVKETAVTHSDGHVTVSKTSKVTGKGQTYFVNRYVPGSEVAA